MHRLGSARTLVSVGGRCGGRSVGNSGAVILPNPRAPQVITAKVVVDDLEDTVLASGTIQARKGEAWGRGFRGRSSACMWTWAIGSAKGNWWPKLIRPRRPTTFAQCRSSGGLVDRAASRQRWPCSKQTELTYARSRICRIWMRPRRQSWKRRKPLWPPPVPTSVLDAQVNKHALWSIRPTVNLGYTRILAPSMGWSSG